MTITIAGRDRVGLIQRSAGILRSVVVQQWNFVEPRVAYNSSVACPGKRAADAIENDCR